ncbi:MAG: cache domain-containing protein, partial [Ruminiclostridium sp.]|nr:cache domain-containing protein [Ruminiclostridium sp.]
MFKKLGLQIVLSTISIVIVVIAVMLTVSVISFRSYNDSIMLQRAVVGMQVLEDKVDNVLKNLEDAYSMMKEDGDFRDAAEAADEPILKDYMSKKLPGDDFYMVVGDRNGTIIYTSSNYPLKSFDYSSVFNGRTIKGIARCDGELVAMFASYVKDQDGQEFMLCLGMNMKAYDWLDEVMKISNCDATIWNWDIRFATTLKRDNGERATGTDLNEDVQEAVLKKDGTYLGQHDVVDRHYYVSYQTMKDYDGNIIGAYWAGADARDADSEFGKVTAVAIIIGVVGGIAVALFIFIFCQKRVTVPLKHAEEYANEMLIGQLSRSNVNFKFAQDEVGNFVEVLKNAKEGMSGVVNDSSRILAAMADGDFTETPSVKY